MAGKQKTHQGKWQGIGTSRDSLHPYTIKPFIANLTFDYLPYTPFLNRRRLRADPPTTLSAQYLHTITR